MSFSFDKFLRPLTSTDRNIKIYEDNGILKYTINPFHIKNINVLNNTMRINLDSDRSIAMVFSTNNEAKISLKKLQEEHIDVLTEKVPFMIDKDILNYVTANIKIGPTGSNGTSGLSKIYTGTSSNYLTIPAYGSLVQLYTQTDLGFVPGQTIVVYKDFPENNYVEGDAFGPYYADSDPVYMIGDIDTYNPSTGQLAFIANICQPTGATSSFWYINLTGQRGQDGTSGTSGTSGHDGLSAFEVWIAAGSPNTPGVIGEEIYNDFLYAIRGPEGVQGGPGPEGTSGTSGIDGTSGTSGISGLSAYELWIEAGEPNTPGVIGEPTFENFLYAIQGPEGPQGGPGQDGAEGPKGATGSSFDIGFGNGLLLVGNTMSIGGTLYETLGMNGANNDLIATGFDNISMTSSVFDVVSDFISLDSDDTQILAINDITISAAGQLALTGDSTLVVTGNNQGLVYQSDYSTGFVDNSLVSKKYVDDNIPSGATGSTGKGSSSVWNASEEPQFPGNFWVVEPQPSPTTAAVQINAIDLDGNDQSDMFTTLSGLIVTGIPTIFIITNGEPSLSILLSSCAYLGSGIWLISGEIITNDTLGGPGDYVVSYSIKGNSGTSGTSGVDGTSGTSGLSGIDGASSLRWIMEDAPGVDPSGNGLFTVSPSANLVNTTLFKFSLNSLNVAGSQGFWDTIGNSISIGKSAYLQVTQVDNPTTIALYKVSNVFWNGSYEISVDAPAVYGNGNFEASKEYSVSFSITGANGTSGVNGAEGPQGQSSNLFYYKGSTASTLINYNPGAGFISWVGGAGQTGSTSLNVHMIEEDGTDIDVFLALIIKGQEIIIQDRDVSGSYQKWVVSGTTSFFLDTYWNIPVTYVNSGGAGTSNFSDNEPLFLGIFNASGTSGTSGVNGTSGTSGTTGTSGTSGTSGTTPTTDWTLSGSLTVSGTSSLSGHTILSEISETINVTPGATASTVVYDFSTGAIWYHATASTNYTANFTNLPTDNNRVITATIMISQGVTPYIPTAVQIGGASQVIKWAGGTASGTANKLDIVGFTFVSAGSVWAQVLGQISYFG